MNKRSLFVSMIARLSIHRLVIWAALGTFLCTTSCKKDNPEEEIPDPLPPIAETLEIGLTEAQNAQLEAMSDSFIVNADLQLSDGTSALSIIEQLDPAWLSSGAYMGRTSDYSAFTADEQRNLLLAKMLVVANYLVDDTQHQYPDEGPGKPACNGLMYGFGSRQYQHRTKPVGPRGGNDSTQTTCVPDLGCVSDSIYGLDCSALVYWISYNAGLRFEFNERNTPSGFFGDPVNWTNAMTLPGSDNYNKLIVEQVQPNSGTGTVPVSEMQSGDIITFGNPIFHIGIVVGSGSKRYFYQSNGTGFACPNSGNGCGLNGGANRGPRMLEMKQNQVSQFSSIYKVFRIGKRCPNNVMDNDGNLIPVVPIGTQCWCAENLKSTHYANLDAIEEVTDPDIWAGLNTGAYCNYENDLLNESVYGHLYNAYTVSDPRNVCPDGWHVPTQAELTLIINLYGGVESAGLALKSTSVWNPSTGVGNQSEFTALPGGARYENGVFGNLTDSGFWWTETTSGSGFMAMSLTAGSSFVGMSAAPPERGFSVRCVRD